MISIKSVSNIPMKTNDGTHCSINELKKKRSLENNQRTKFRMFHALES